MALRLWETLRTRPAIPSAATRGQCTAGSTVVQYPDVSLANQGRAETAARHAASLRPSLSPSGHRREKLQHLSGHLQPVLSGMASSAKRKQEEKHLKMLREMTSLPPNRKCFDCDQRGPTYTDMTVGSFVCTSCSGIL